MSLNRSLLYVRLSCMRLQASRRATYQRAQSQERRGCGDWRLMESTYKCCGSMLTYSTWTRHTLTTSMLWPMPMVLKQHARPLSRWRSAWSSLKNAQLIEESISPNNNLLSCGFEMMSDQTYNQIWELKVNSIENLLGTVKEAYTWITSVKLSLTTY